MTSRNPDQIEKPPEIKPEDFAKVMFCEVYESCKVEFSQLLFDFLKVCKKCKKFASLTFTDFRRLSGRNNCPKEAQSGLSI